MTCTPLLSWTPGGRLETTATELAAALLIDAGAVRSAVHGDHLVVEHRDATLVITGTSDADNDEDDEDDEELDDYADPEGGDAGDGDAEAEAERNGTGAGAGRDDSEHADVMRDHIRRYQEAERLAGLRRRPPAGPPPRHGLVNNDIVVLRDGRRVTLAPCPMNDPNTACETAGGIVVAGDHIVELTRFERAAYVKWDGSLVELGALRADFKVNREGTVLAAMELGTGRRARSMLHLIDLVEDTRHTVAMEWNPDFRITGVTHDTIWFRRGWSQPEVSWTVGDTESAPAAGPAPVGSWEGPAAPALRHYTAHHCGRSFDAGESITITDDAGRRTYRVPEPGRVDHRCRPSWEDPDHLLLVPGVTMNGGLEFLGCVFRLDVNTGALETAATDTDVKTFIEPWPHPTA